jgi:hypothetical protein
VFDVALADSHWNAVKEWGATVWKAWAEHHATIADFVATHLPDIFASK